MDLTVKTPSTDLCISVAQVKANKRIKSAAEDELIGLWIEAAQEWVAAEAQISILPTVYTARWQSIYPEVELLRPTVSSIASLKKTPKGGTLTTVLGNALTTFKRDMLTIVTVPDITTAIDGVLEIEYTAGYADAGSVPARIKQAVLLLASHWMTSREAGHMDPRLMDIEKEIPFGVRDLVSQFRVPNTTALLD